MRGALFGAVSGSLFGVGLALSGMTRPQKVLGFLDVTGAWDASLAFVMVGAILVYAVAYRVIVRRSAPLFAARFFVPAREHLDAPLLLGAALFGIGWGLGGFCPGPALVALGAVAPHALAFVAAMTAGIVLQRLTAARLAAAPTDAHDAGHGRGLGIEGR